MEKGRLGAYELGTSYKRYKTCDIRVTHLHQTRSYIQAYTQWHILPSYTSLSWSTLLALENSHGLSLGVLLLNESWFLIFCYISLSLLVSDITFVDQRTLMVCLLVLEIKFSCVEALNSPWTTLRSHIRTVGSGGWSQKPHIWYTKGSSFYVGISW